MRFLVLCCTFVFFGASIVWSEEDQELTKAKEVYQDVVTKQKELLKTAFEREVTKVTRTGKLTLVQEIQDEQKAFLEGGDLPASTAMKVSVQKYRKAVDSARERLESTYERKVIALTKAEKFEDAKAAQADLKGFLTSLAAGKDPNEPEPVNEPAPENEPVADDQQAISLVGALWKQDGLFGEPGDQTLDATNLVKTQLFTRGRFEVNNGTLGNLDGRPASKSLFLQMQIFRNPVHMQLHERSVIAFGQLSADDANKPGVRMGNTRLELFEVLWKTAEGQMLGDLTESVTKELQKGPVEVRSPVFPDLAEGKSKLAIFRFRAGPQTVEFAASDYSTVVFPMNAAINYPVPWAAMADETPLKVGFQNVKWMLADGRDDSEVTQKAAAILNTRKAVSCDQMTFGKIGQTKGPRVLDLDMVVNDAKFHLKLAEGSHLSIHNASNEQLKKPGELIPGTPVVIVDVWWSTLDESTGMSGGTMTQALWEHPCRIEPPIFEDKTNPGQVRKAVINLRVGKRVLKIGALTGSTFEIIE